MRDSRILRALEATAVLLFLVQAVRVLFSVLFGLIYDAIFSETLAISTLGLVMLCVRIDFVWARGLEMRDAQVLDSLASDHRCVVVELALP